MSEDDILPEDDIELLTGTDWAKWQVPAVAGKKPERKTESAQQGLLTAAQLDQLRKQAREEGYAAGYQEGQTRGQQELRGVIAQWCAMLDALQQPLTNVQEGVEEELVQLAQAIARQLVRRELELDPEEIFGVVRQALAALPAASQNIRVELHPEDAALFEQLAGDQDRGWSIIENEALDRGGCRVRSETSLIDERLETRLNRIVVRAMGGHRKTDVDHG